MDTTNYEIVWPTDKPRCQYEGCTNVAASKGNGEYRRYCEKHRRWVQKLGRPCAIEGCTNDAMKWKHHGLCEEHFQQIKPEPKLCSVEGCPEELYSVHSRFCHAHRAEHRRKLRLQREARKRQRRFDRRTCKVAGCTNPTVKLKGVRLCQQHYDEREARWKAGAVARNRERERRYKKQPCWVCGWKGSSIDRHRILPGELGGTYCKSNCMALCPNCHRLAHHDPLKFNRKMRRALMGDCGLLYHLTTVADALAGYWQRYLDSRPS